MGNSEKIKKYFRTRTVCDWIVLTLHFLLFVYLVGSIIYFAVKGRGRDCGVSAAYLLVIPVYFLFERFVRVKIPLFTAAVFILFIAWCSLGASFNFYTVIPFLDDILHGVWGFVFTVIGFTLIKAATGEPETKKSFVIYAVFGFAFCCMTSVLWEIFEFSTDMLMPSVDQQEDTLVSCIHSFILHPEYDHLHTEIIEGIAYTQLYDADGNLLYTINGGYLDLGIIDTMCDLICSSVVSFAVSLALIIEKCAGKKGIYKLIIPRLVPRNKELPNNEELSFNCN
ncbi:MAG: hypothetical protein K2N22_03220 [Clostridia bacterium]|nr:hypothetical protein [Clostridia bacterium]